MAKAADIKTQFEILLAGGTDTAAIQVSRAGVKVAALSVPCRYVHTGVEMLDLDGRRGVCRPDGGMADRGDRDNG